MFYGSGFVLLARATRGGGEEEEEEEEEEGRRFVRALMRACLMPGFAGYE